MKLIVAGSRNFNNWELLKDQLNIIHYFNGFLEIVSGCARGADQLGERYSLEFLNRPATKFPADWNKYGKSAGYIRNEEMAKYADACIVFWDGKSSGTKHMINLANKYKLKLRIIKYDN